ncbi:hypothetical protein BgiBS90_024768, partial [Biomphalaria glabrata]
TPARNDYEMDKRKKRRCRPKDFTFTRSVFETVANRIIITSGSTPNAIKIWQTICPTAATQRSRLHIDLAGSDLRFDGRQPDLDVLLVIVEYIYLQHSMHF